MEPNYSSSSKSKQGGGSNSPSSANAKSYINELFGPKPSSSQPPSGVNSSIFNSVFGPPSTGGRSGQAGNAKHGAPGNGSKGENNRNAYFQQEPVDQSACYFSNSIYYGGQEAYSPTTPSKDSLNFKKDQQDDDPDSASRGNWWQGSLYY